MRKILEKEPRQWANVGPSVKKYNRETPWTILAITKRKEAPLH